MKYFIVVAFVFGSLAISSCSSGSSSGKNGPSFEGTWINQSKGYNMTIDVLSKGNKFKIDWENNGQRAAYAYDGEYLHYLTEKRSVKTDDPEGFAGVGLKKLWVDHQSTNRVEKEQGPSIVGRETVEVEKCFGGSECTRYFIDKETGIILQIKYNNGTEYK
ncbi:hypothetical protein BVX98_02220, partial [bacterium F11]